MEYLFNFNGQERHARKVLIDEKIASAEEVALMLSSEVSDKIQEHYKVLSTSGEEIVLLKKDCIEQFLKIGKILYR